MTAPKYKPFSLPDRLKHVNPEFFESFTAKIKSAPAKKEDREIEFNNIKVNISILRPVRSKDDEELPIVLFLHGGGWIMGSCDTHRILTNELVNLLPCCVIFVHYSLSPEVKYPIALKEYYAVLCWVQQNAASIHVDPKRLAISGDSAGGNLSAALTIYANDYGNKGISYQVLYYPLLGADFENESYVRNKNNVNFPRIFMEYAWQCYLDSAEQYKIPTAVPMSSSLDVLKGLPSTLIITAERDVVRSKGEAYANKLTKAGVSALCVRYLNMDHEFVTTYFSTPQASAAIAQTVHVLRKHWSSGESKL